MSPSADNEDYGESVGASTTVVVVGAGPSGLMLAYDKHFPTQRSTPNNSQGQIWYDLEFPS